MDIKIYEAFNEYIDEYLDQAIISNSTKEEAIQKIKIRPVLLKSRVKYQVTEFCGQKVLHQNFDKEELLLKLPEWFDGLFKQVQIHSNKADISILISKKGKVTVKVKKRINTENNTSNRTNNSTTNSAINNANSNEINTGNNTDSNSANIIAYNSANSNNSVNNNKNTNKNTDNITNNKSEDINWIPLELPLIKEHNRSKNYILKEGEYIPFLVDLGVMTKEGKILKAKYDKYKQINRFLEFIEDVLPSLNKEQEIKIIDFGCGKSYLTFAMHYYLREMKGYKVRITGLDLKEDVIKHCNELKVRYGYDDLQFLQGDIASYEGTNQVDMVVTLHACDTATDYAIYKAIKWGASVILSVPCCQHELNKQVECNELKDILKYGLIKERMSALITDALRANLLETLGYKVQVMEFIDMEHTPKNILLRAVKNHTLISAANKQKLLNNYKSTLEFLHVNPKLYDLLAPRGDML